MAVGEQGFAVQHRALPEFVQHLRQMRFAGAGGAHQVQRAAPDRLVALQSEDTGEGAVDVADIAVQVEEQDRVAGVIEIGRGKGGRAATVVGRGEIGQLAAIEAGGMQANGEPAAVLGRALQHRWHGAIATLGRQAQLRGGAADRFGTDAFPQGLRRGIEEHHAPLGVDHDHSVDGLFERCLP